MEFFQRPDPRPLGLYIGDTSSWNHKIKQQILQKWGIKAFVFKLFPFKVWKNEATSEVKSSRSWLQAWKRANTREIKEYVYIYIYICTHTHISRTIYAGKLRTRTVNTTKKYWTNTNIPETGFISARFLIYVGAAIYGWTIPYLVCWFSPADTVPMGDLPAVSISYEEVMSALNYQLWLGWLKRTRWWLLGWFIALGSPWYTGRQILHVIFPLSSTWDWKKDVL